MKIEDDDDDSLALKARLGIGDDTPPLLTIVGEPPPSHWGKITSRGRTTSSEYLDFLKRNRERNGK
jgi:hypothetical protein